MASLQALRYSPASTRSRTLPCLSAFVVLVSHSSLIFCSIHQFEIPTEDDDIQIIDEVKGTGAPTGGLPAVVKSEQIDEQDEEDAGEKDHKCHATFLVHFLNCRVEF